MTSDISSDESLDELLQRVKSSQRSSDQAVARYRSTQNAQWQQLAGAALEQMLQSRQAAEKFLSDADPKRRIAALSILASHWKPDGNLAAVTEKLAFDDSDLEVRNVAVLVIGDCFVGTNDARATKMFAGLVNDSAHPETFRQWAYLGLCKVCRPIDDWPDVPTFRFPDDVDWHFVHSLLEG